jgi:hypothetical protein
MPTNRKALIREYKETPRTMGVGVIRNTVDGRVLVISGANLPGLLNRHHAQLRLGAHSNRELQKDWQTHGAAAFSFDILDTLTPPADKPDFDPADDLRALEGLWIEKLGSLEPSGYNRATNRAGHSASGPS